MRMYLLSGFVAAAFAVSAHASEVASEIWLSDIGTVGSGVAQSVPNLKLRDGAHTIYIWARPQDGETLKNVRLNLRSTVDTVLDFAGVTVHNPFLATDPGGGPDIHRYETVVDTPNGQVNPDVDPDSLKQFGGFTVANTELQGVGLGPTAAALDPLYDASAEAFLFGTVEFDAVGPASSMTELFLQIGFNGANLDGEGAGETNIVFGDPQDPPLNAATQREVDSATPDAIIYVVPEPSSIWFFVLALLAVAVRGRIVATRSRICLGVSGRANC